MDILLVLLVCVIIQSIFGVGVLLFGTPLLLLMGYDFLTTLSILLPVSIAINLLQIMEHPTYVGKKLFIKFFFISIPVAIISLYYIMQTNLNLNLIIGLFVLFSAMSYFSKKIVKYLDYFMQYEKTYLFIMGLVHGISNLGGAFLTPYINHKFDNKITIRANIALLYMTFAIFQLITMYFTNKAVEFNLQYIFLAISIYLISNKYLFKNIDQTKYKKIFYLFLSIFGFLLIYKGLFVCLG